MDAGLRAALSMAVFIVMVSAGLIWVQTPGTAEFVISVFSLIIGLIFLGLVVLVIRRVSK
jgi:hypothetical protein